MPRRFTSMRISRLERAQVDETCAAVYDRFQQVRGNVPRMLRTVAHRPELLKTMFAHFHAIMETGTLGLKFKELIFVWVSQLNQCEYCLSAHLPLAEQSGWSDEALASLDHVEESTFFTEREKAALRYAERMIRDSNRVDDDLWAELRGHFDEGEIVELTSAIGLFHYFNVFNNALQMEST